MKKLLIALLLILIHSVAFAEDTFTIITHPDVNEGLIDQDALKKIYLGKKSRWSDGTKIQPATLKQGSAHSSFLTTVVNKTPSQFRTYWKRAIFTGTRSPVKTFGDQEALVNFVRENKGAVAYISHVADVEGVKVLKVQ